MKISGYREADRALLAGPWIPGELLALPVADRPPLADPHTVALPDGGDHEELFVVRDTAVVRYADIDWVARRARLEIGVREGAEDRAAEVLAVAVPFAFGVLGLRRLHGRVTLSPEAPVAALEKAGFGREGVALDDVWFGGVLTDREIWAVLGDD
ncbi:MAG TPA: GNAT family protein [Streptomyces sp.]